MNKVPSNVIDRFSSTSVLNDSNIVSTRTIQKTELRLPTTDRTEEDIHKHTVQLDLDENNDCEDIPDVQWRMNSDGHYKPDGKEIKTSGARKIQNDTIDIEADCVDIPDIKWNNDGTIKEEAGDSIYDLKEREKSYKIGKNGEKIFLWPQKEEIKESEDVGAISTPVEVEGDDAENSVNLTTDVVASSQASSEHKVYADNEEVKKYIQIVADIENALNSLTPVQRGDREQKETIIKNILSSYKDLLSSDDVEDETVVNLIVANRDSIDNACTSESQLVKDICVVCRYLMWHF